MYNTLTPCLRDDECLSGACEANPFRAVGLDIAPHVPLSQRYCRLQLSAEALVQCMITGIHPILRGTLAGLLDLSPSAADSVLAAELTVVLGSAGYSFLSGDWWCPWRSDMIRDASTALREACDDDYGIFPDHFCGSGDCETASGPCFEVSRTAGCFANFSESSVLCEEAGGIALQVTPRYGDWRVSCAFPNWTSPDLCFPPERCQPSRLIADPSTGRTYCPSYCLLPATSEADCTCQSTYSPDLCESEGLQLVWRQEFGTCEIASVPDLEILCSYLGGEIWLGTLWQEAYLTDQQSCEAAGLCTADALSLMRSVAGEHAFDGGVYSKTVCEALEGCDLGTHRRGRLSRARSVLGCVPLRPVSQPGAHLHRIPVVCRRRHRATGRARHRLRGRVLHRGEHEFSADRLSRYGRLV